MSATTIYPSVPLEPLTNVQERCGKNHLIEKVLLTLLSNLVTRLDTRMITCLVYEINLQKNTLIFLLS